MELRPSAAPPAAGRVSSQPKHKHLRFPSSCSLPRGQKAEQASRRREENALGDPSGSHPHTAPGHICQLALAAGHVATWLKAAWGQSAAIPSPPEAGPRPPRLAGVPPATSLLGLRLRSSEMGGWNPGQKTGCSGRENALRRGLGGREVSAAVLCYVHWAPTGRLGTPKEQRWTERSAAAGDLHPPVGEGLGVLHTDLLLFTLQMGQAPLSGRNGARAVKGLAKVKTDKRQGGGAARSAEPTPVLTCVGGGQADESPRVLKSSLHCSENPVFALTAPVFPFCPRWVHAGGHRNQFLGGHAPCSPSSWLCQGVFSLSKVSVLKRKSLPPTHTSF